jgi:hypothetical protein
MSAVVVVAAMALAMALAMAAIGYLVALTLAAAVFDTHAHVRLFFRVRRVAAEAERCAVCLDLGCGAVTACGHAFHAACIARWLARATTCPVCRADLLAPDRRAAYGVCVDASAHVEALTCIYLGS